MKIILFFVVLIALGLGTKYFIANKGEIGKLDDKPAPTTESDSTPVSISSRVLAVGNVAWGGSLNDLSEGSALKEAYPFSGLSSLSRNQYDAWVGELNCSIGTTLSDSCKPNYLQEAKKWFNVLALGNSNTNKNNSIISARDALKRVGIQFTGDENADLIGEICEVVTLPARFQLGDSSYKAALLPLAVCSVNATTVTPDIAQYDEVARFSKVLPTWVYVYKGDSNVIAQNEFQKSIYRSYIDSGAELVLGTSPYAVQGAESYKGKLILYSLGNFIYPGKESDSEFYKGIALSATISAKMDNNMSSWVDLAKACKDANDSCLGLAKDKGLSRPAYSYGLSIVATDNLKAGVVMKTTNSMWEEQASKRLGIDALLPTLDLLNR